MKTTALIPSMRSAENGFMLPWRSAENGFTSSWRSAENGFTSSWRSAENGFTSSWRSAENGFTSSWRSAENGFTLLEMLVALTVLSLAALALVRLDAFTVQSSAALNRNAVAMIVANNVATTYLTDPAPPTIGSATDNVTNGGTVWRVATHVAATADPSLLRIDIRVYGVDGGQAILTTIRPAG